MTTDSIEVSDLSVRLGDRLALDSVTLTLEARRIAVIGANGSGKSTFARVLGGLIAPTSGSLSVLGVDPVAERTQLRRLVSLVFSNPDAQIIMPTVAEDAAFSLRSARLPRSEVAERVREALDQFGLTELADRAAHDLSGGQKQLLALCGAVIRRPQLLIADEPTAYLDARNSRLIADHLLAPSDRRLVLVSHDLALAERCDVAVLFEDGRMLGLGDPADIVSRYEASLAC
ncbi:energy-coupling factor ABC transporter ATP-binding protein [Subtercola sp. YIM 133946]|uniref:energy-coupling factor ABC transporter ATP-binding protein n=1 Tax=Subtercola sp. YIM 133946 TaxID=3118909 RepID=UPI002F9203AD